MKNIKRYHVAALTILGWALIVTEPSPRTIKTGFQTREACDTAASDWRASYKRQLKLANQTNNPNRRRRLPKAIPPTKCVDEAQTTVPPA